MNELLIPASSDAMKAQTLATRAYQAVNHICLGKAKKGRFKSKGRGLDSYGRIEALG